MIVHRLVHVYDTPLGFPNVRVRTRVGRMLAIALLAVLFCAFAYVMIDIVVHRGTAPTLQVEPMP